MNKIAFATLAAFLGGMTVAPSAVVAEDLPATHVKVLGIHSNLNMYKTVEKPFWTDTVSRESNGKISVHYVSMTEVGLKGTEQLRLARLGVVEFFSGNISPMSADNVAFDGLDLIGTTPTMEIARKAVEAYKPVLAKPMAELFNTKLLMVWPNPAQVIYCKPEITGLAGLKGKKVRVGHRSMGDFVEAAGGTAVVLPWAEVITAFQRGTVDCGITGTLSGNTAKWWEVTTHLLPITLSWGMWIHAVNLDTWNRLDPKVQAFFEKQFAKQEDRMWALASKETQDGINCNTGKGTCTYGYKGSMTLVPVTEADLKKLQGWAESTLVPRWAKECGEACVKKWNATVGKVTGITASAK